MADQKISDLPASGAIADADLFEAVQTATSVKGTFAKVKTWIKSWITKADVGLGNVSNLTPADMPISDDVADALALKQNASGTAAAAKAAAVADAIVDGVTDVAPSQNAVFDALALKQTASGTAAAAKAAAVADAIVDGVTDVAPSQNAVFDALALKQTASGTAAAAKAAAVADAIVDGVTDVAPSQNAVYDTLKFVGFVANKNAVNQTGIASNTATKITFTTEQFDAGGYYDAANSRWTPPAGFVNIKATVRFDPANLTNADNCSIMLYKNGALFKYGSSLLQQAVAQGTLFDVIDQANGTDYYEVYVSIVTTSSTGTVRGAINSTYFSGVLLSPF